MWMIGIWIYILHLKMKDKYVDSVILASAFVVWPVLVPIIFFILLGKALGRVQDRMVKRIKYAVEHKQLPPSKKQAFHGSYRDPWHW